MPLMYSVYPDAAKALGGMSRSKIYMEIKEGRLSVVKVGRRTFITVDELERYVSELSKTAK